MIALPNHINLYCSGRQGPVVPDQTPPAAAFSASSVTSDHHSTLHQQSTFALAQKCCTTTIQNPLPRGALTRAARTVTPIHYPSFLLEGKYREPRNWHPHATGRYHGCNTGNCFCCHCYYHVREYCRPVWRWWSVYDRWGRCVSDFPLPYDSATSCKKKLASLPGHPEGFGDFSAVLLGGS